MKAVGLKILKNKLSEYVRLAAGGETILVTDRDQVVAEMGPPRQSRGLSEALLADSIRKGWVTPPLLPPEAPPRVPHAPDSQIQQGLEHDREDR